MHPKLDHHMTSDEFRKAGKEVVDWIADYYDWVESQPVVPAVEPGDILAQLPPLPPQKGEPFDRVMSDVDTYIMPGITHWQSPNFFAYFPSNTSFPSILGEMVSAGLGVQGMVWKTSPSCTELETLVMDWVVNLLGLPARFLSTGQGGGVIHDTASSAVLCAMLAARERITKGSGNAKGVPSNLVAYTSTQAHSSVQKAARIAGIGDENLRLVDVDASFAMDPAALKKAIDEDVAAGKTPFFVSATVGTTSSLAMDPIPAIKAQLNDSIWLHIDAAMAGSAAVCPEFRDMHKGIEGADSYCFNPHKWLFTNFDCSCFFVADRNALIGALSILPEYLRTAEHAAGAIDYRDWQVPLGRRFRALKLWFVIRHYGAEGLQSHVRQHIELAKEFEKWVIESDQFDLVVQRTLNTVCFADKRGDQATKAILDKVNASGKLFASHTKLNDRYTISMMVGQRTTELRHVRTAWERFSEAASEYRKG